MDQSLLRLTDTDFPLNIIEHKKTNAGVLFKSHYHQHHLQLFYFTYGSAVIFCSRNKYEVKKGDILLINPKELHYGENMSSDLRYYVFRIDLKLLCSCSPIAAKERYLKSILNGQILFKNVIDDRNVENILNDMINKYKLHEEGYELNLLGYVYKLLSISIHSHKDKLYTQKDAEILMKKTRRFAEVFEYIDKNYKNTITLKELSEYAHMSESYFCRTFKKSTGRTPFDYINYVRIEKAVSLLNQGICNVTEAGMMVGFDDINYFSRVFKKYMSVSPAHYIKNDRKYFL